MTIFRELRGPAGPGAPRRPQGGIKLFLFHHAGGSSASFHEFPRCFPPNWRLCAVELSGREASASTGEFLSASEAAAVVLPGLTAAVDGPYAILGHSMGALVAYELVRELEQRRVPPVWLGISAMPAPGRLAGRWRDGRHLWPREALVSFMRSLGGTSEEMLADPDLVDYMVAILRYDLAVVETYEYVAGPPLRVPVSVFTGEQDPLTTQDQVGEWHKYSTAPVAFHAYPGGHFFLFEQAASIARCVVNDVGELLDS